MFEARSSTMLAKLFVLKAAAAADCGVAALLGVAEGDAGRLDLSFKEKGGGVPPSLRSRLDGVASKEPDDCELVTL